MDAPARRPWIRAAAFPVLLALPFLALPLGSSDVPGAEPEPRFPPFSVASVFDGSWQAGVERWYDRTFGLRRYWIRSANQAQFSLFSEIPWREGRELVLGKDRTLHQASYLKALMGLDEIPAARLERFARELRLVQDRLRERGISFVFFLTPSKAALEPEDLPPLPGPLRAVNYERLLPYLASHGVNLVDARAMASAFKSRVGRPVFPKGGIHWDQELALRATQDLLARLETLAGKPMVRLRYREPAPMGAPRRGDSDLAELANLWWTRPFQRPVPQPVVEVEAAPGSLRPRIYFVGGSFLGLPLKLLGSTGAADPATTRNFYGGKRIVDVAAELEGVDAVVMETNEAAVPWLGFGFIEAILGGEPPPRPH